MMNDSYLSIFSDVVTVKILCKTPIETNLLFRLRQSARDGNIKIFRDPLGNPVGYAAWFSINKESLVQMSNSKSLPSFPHEWNEGYLRTLYDVNYAPGWNKLAGDLFRDFIKSNRLIVTMRRSGVKIWFRCKNKYRCIKF